MKGVIYCRVSSKEQIEGTSLESQEVACREYAQAKNIEILRVFVEQGESAKFADRTQLLELIDFCRKRKGIIGALLVWKVDRFARNVADHFSIKATLGKYGVRIVSVTEPIDTNPEGKLMETMLAGFAQFDNDIRAMRTVQGMRRKVQDGIVPWRAPLGYRSPVTGRGKKTVPDLPDEPTFSLLRKAFREFATGAHTQAEMGRLMTSWGLSPSPGQPFAPESLSKLFSNPFYAGIIVSPWTGEEHDGKHVPLITREHFARVQSILAARRHSVPHQKTRPEFPLRGLARCGGCGGSLTAGYSRGRKNRYAYYLCQRRDCKRKGKSHPDTAIHSEFEDFLDDVAPKAQTLRLIQEEILARARATERDVVQERQQRTKRIARVNSEIAELIRMRAESLITTEEFRSQKQRMVEQRAVLQHSSETIRIDRIKKDLESIVEPLTDLRATWRTLEPSFRHRFERLILPGGFVIGRIRTAGLGLLFTLFQPSESIDSIKVHLGTEKLNPLFSEIHEFSEVVCSTTRTTETLHGEVQLLE